MEDLERRSAALEVRGRRISGLAVPYGARARVSLPSGEHVQETFVSGAFGKDMKSVPLLVEHGGKQVGEVTPSTSARGLEIAGEYDGNLGDRSKFSIEFRARAETRSQDLRIVTDALLEGVAAVLNPAYGGAQIESRQGASLTLVEGPVGSGKSEVLKNLLETSAVDLVADTTPLWSALRLIERGPDGSYPERLRSDPALLTALYLKTTTARRALSEGLKVAVSTSTPNQAAKWRAIADEFDASFSSQLVDPGEAVVRQRLGGEAISEECLAGVQRWYGSRRSVLSPARRRLLAAI